MLCLAPETANFAYRTGCDIAAVGCDSEGHRGPEALPVQQMNRIARAAETSDLPVYVHALNQ